MAEREEPDDVVGTVDVTVGADGTPVIKLSGEIDMSNVESFQGVVDWAVEQAPALLVFDLGAVDFMDSSGLSLVLRVAAAAQAVEVREPSAIVRRVIEATGLSDVLPIRP